MNKRIKYDMSDRITQRNVKKLISFYIIINAVFLIELLPTIGFSLPIVLSSRRIIVVLFFFSFLLLCKNHVVNRKRISTLFLITNVYFLAITITNNSIQQQPFYYYFAAVLYPWIITFITEIIAGNIKKEEAFNKTVLILSTFSFLYIFLIIRYKFGISSIITASGESSIYYVITLLPFVLCCKEKYRNFMLILFVLSVFVTLKRTALIAIVLGMFAYFWVKFREHDEKKFKVVVYALLGTLMFFIIYEIVVKYTGNDLIEKLLNTREDGGSNRELILNTVIEKFRNTTLSEKLFGVGYNGVRYSYSVISAGTVVSAHNDFLEILCDYGLVGLFLYLVIIFRIIKNFVYMKKIESVYAPAYAAAIMIFFVLSMFSHLILYTSYFMNLLIFFVMMESVIDNNSYYKGGI